MLTKPQREEAGASILPANPAQWRFAAVSQAINLGPERLYTVLFHTFGERFSVQNERIAEERLRAILEAVFTLSNRRGFQAMSLRDLSKEAGLSMGGLYAYLSSKDDLVSLIQDFLRHAVENRLMPLLDGQTTPRAQLEGIVRGHLYLSEILQPWFYFAFMEAKNLPTEQRRVAIEADREAEALIEQIIREGVTQGAFKTRSPATMASFIKALLQEWYLKRAKYDKRGLDVDHYADDLMETLQAAMSTA